MVMLLASQESVYCIELLHVCSLSLFVSLMDFVGVCAVALLFIFLCFVVVFFAFVFSILCAFMMFLSFDYFLSRSLTHTLSSFSFQFLFLQRNDDSFASLAPAPFMD
mmetsp:Transcript_6184/g.4666  ORF Transcript_6184/g.4666 Transcript_6184/m.4666 type:complete len:107 (+) Transcript_6184:234-554(+)